MDIKKLLFENNNYTNVKNNIKITKMERNTKNS